MITGGNCCNTTTSRIVAENARRVGGIGGAAAVRGGEGAGTAAGIGGGGRRIIEMPLGPHVAGVRLRVAVRLLGDDIRARQRHVPRFPRSEPPVQLRRTGRAAREPHARGAPRASADIPAVGHLQRAVEVHLERRVRLPHHRDVMPPRRDRGAAAVVQRDIAARVVGGVRLQHARRGVHLDVAEVVAVIRRLDGQQRR